MTSTRTLPAAFAVTGAAGFIGRHLCDALRRLGCDVRAFVRSPSAYPWREPGIRAFSCDLPDRIDAEGLGGAAAVLHLAYVTRHQDREEAYRVNDLGTRRLLSASRDAGVPRFVFISSQSAHDSAASYYGRSKRTLEGLMQEGRDLVLRPGLVLGAGSAGLFERMCETVRRARVIPLFGGGRQPLQTVHVQDLCAAIIAALDRGLSGRFTLAEPEPTSMGDFLKGIAVRLDRRPLFLPFPIGPALAVLRSIEALRIPFPVSSENLLGLRQMRSCDTATDLATIGVRLRPAAESLDEILGKIRIR